ncbi:MAG: helix-turn-helix transcriptional regulator [Elusimicrobia bacterium]|nr:helix-turn-helix transcriptional regulator [Elusimicrobiota bacterium]
MDKGTLNRKLEKTQERVAFGIRKHFFQLEVQILLALEDRGWSYEDLAKATGIRRQNIWRDLKNGGLHKASLDRVSRYAEALGLHAYYFLLNTKQEKEILPRLERALAYA